MPHYKEQVYGPQPINQVWYGTPKSGFIPATGGFEHITYLDHNLSRLGHGDQGGPMILQRSLRLASPGLCYAGAGAGSEVVTHPSAFSTGPSEPYNSTLYGYGGTAIARTLPTNPMMEGADTIAQSIQFRKNLPKAIGANLWRDRMLTFKTLGSEYLNIEFGWKPFISDVMDVMRCVRDSADYYRKLYEGSGVKTRRGYRFPSKPTALTNPGSTNTYSVDSTLSGWQAGSLVYVGSKEMRIWFKGCYTYQLPISLAQMTKMQKYRSYADHVLGLKPTLENVWDAAPWTWAVDWAVDAGDVARNISRMGRDGLFLEYGYIMCHAYTRETWFATGATHSGPGSRCTGNSFTHIDEWKVRFPASPYGFGLTYEGLSVSQKAILAAAGISHLNIESL
jgi:hypothetical protein